MDARETTRGEYDAFVAAKVGSAGQPPECTWNTQFTPLLYDPVTEDTPPPGAWCDVKDWSGVSPDAAVGCVDFCDALAYCQWAGKRLCGRVGGNKKWGSVYDANVASVKDWDGFVKNVPTSLESEFTNACTQGGKTKYAYGDQAQPGVCIDESWVDAGKPLTIANLENRQCHGSIPPFDAVFDLNGSVGEWQNMCWMQQESCIMSGSLQGCTDDIGTTGMRGVFPGIGVRCCADTVVTP
jgi:formylglycine-generating enzyme required for sulfatase activity